MRAVWCEDPENEGHVKPKRPRDERLPKSSHLSRSCSFSKPKQEFIALETSTMEAPRKSKSKKSSKKLKKSGVRTKFLIESLRNEYYDLKSDNERLRDLVKSNLPKDAADGILAECYDPNAPKAKIDNVDEIATKMAGTGVADDDDDAMGF